MIPPPHSTILNVDIGLGFSRRRLSVHSTGNTWGKTGSPGGGGHDRCNLAGVGIHQQPAGLRVYSSATDLPDGSELKSAGTIKPGLSTYWRLDMTESDGLRFEIDHRS